MQFHKKNANIILIATSISYIVVTLDTSIVNVALQSISNDLSVNISGLQWIVNAYTLTFASLLLTAGTLGDKWGAKRIYLLGFWVFTFSSLLGGFAVNINLLIFARILQGIGAALLVPNSLFLLNQNFTDPKQRSKAIGIWTGLAGTALILAPLFGGILIKFFGWRSIFLVNLPICLIGIWLTIQYIPNIIITKTSKKLDIYGQFLAVFTLLTFVATLIEAPHWGWFSLYTFTSLGLSLVCLILFLIIEHQQSQPMMPLPIFYNKFFSISVYLAMVTVFISYGLFFLLSLYFQTILHYSALQTGLALLPMAIAITISNFSTGYWTQAKGAHWPTFTGLLLLIMGCFFMQILNVQSSYKEILLPLVIVGFGAGLITPAVTSEMLHHVEPHHVGIASGILNTLRQTGLAIGIAMFGAFIESFSFIKGFHLSLWICIFFAISAICLWWATMFKSKNG